MLVIAIPVQAQTVSERVEIDADQFSTNIVSELSTLKGNVILRHQGLVLRCGLAEIFPATETNEPKYVLSEQLALVQNAADYEVTAKAGKATYLPVSNELILEQQVGFKHSLSEQTFEINAARLHIYQKQGQLQQMVATGVPAILSQTFPSKRVVIKAERIDWLAETQTALMKEASLDDGVTTFSASEISYNTVTGAVSAKGQGENRPKYRFNSKQDTEEQQDDGT